MIGIDGRAHDADALALAQDLIDPSGTIIAVALAVLDPFPDDHDPTLVAPLHARADAIAQSFARTRLRTIGRSAVARSVSAGLTAAALDVNADLLVIASSRSPVTSGTSAGGTAHEILRNAPCPVAIAATGEARTEA